MGTTARTPALTPRQQAILAAARDVLETIEARQPDPVTGEHPLMPDEAGTLLDALAIRDELGPSIVERSQPASGHLVSHRGGSCARPSTDERETQ